MKPSPRSLLPLLALPVALAASAYTIDPASFATVLGGAVTTDSEIVTVSIPAGAVVPKADIYLLADTTGSMSAPLANVKTNAADVAAALYGLSGVDVRIGVGNYKDFPYDVYAFDHQLAPAGSGSAADVTAAIDTWTASGGSDGPEGQFFALDRLANDIDPDGGGAIGWRGDAKKIVVWFGDWPGHDAVCAAVSGLSYDITEATVTADLVDAGVTVVAFSTLSGITDGLDADPLPFSADYTADCGAPGGTAGQATRITDATGGQHLTDVSSAELSDAIIDLVGEAVATISSIVLEPSADIDPYVASVTDITPDGCVGLDASVDSECDFDVVFEAECVDGGALVTGTLDAKADGATVASQDVTIEIEDCCDAPAIEAGDVEVWPPNHKYESFTLADCAAAISEDCDGSAIDIDASGFILEISSDEPEDAPGKGDGMTASDIVITGDSSFLLRAERQGAGDGRVYSVTFEVLNQDGDATEATCTFSVPHDLSGAAAVDDGPGAGYTVLP